MLVLIPLKLLLIKPSFHLHFPPHTHKLPIPKPDSAENSPVPLYLHVLGPFLSLKTCIICAENLLCLRASCSALRQGVSISSQKGKRKGEMRGDGWWCPCVISHLPGRGDRASGGHGAGEDPTSKLVGCLLGGVPLGTRTVHYK